MLKELLVPYLTQLEEPSVTLVRPGYKEKYANTKLGGEIYHDLENFEGKPGKSYMLVVAVSPDEYWGDNKNHDSFTEEELKKSHHTFVEKGTFYKNHVNKDPLKNYGDNEKSWYDDEMKRVLVLVGVDHNKAPDIVQDLENGKKISVSMGTKIPYDVCSICGNKAPTRDDYCDHAKFNLGKILPDGRKIKVYNPNCTFFDLSKVIRPAGHIEYMIKRVTPKNATSKQASYLWVPRNPFESHMEKAATMNSSELFDHEQDFADKFAQINKASTMYKVLQGKAVTEDEMDPKLKEVIEKSKDIINLKDSEDFDSETVKKLSEHPLKKVFATSSLMGIIPKIHEFARMIVHRMGCDDVDEIMHNLDNQGWDPMELLSEDDVFEGVKKQPKSIKIIIESKVLDGGLDDVDEKVAELLFPYMEKRSFYRPFLERRHLVPKTPKTAGALDMQPAWDEEGHQYLTTREAIGKSSTEEAFRMGAKALGSGLLMGVGALAAHKLPMIGGKYLIPAGVYGGYRAGGEVSDALFAEPNLSTVPAYTVSKKIASMLRPEEMVGLEKIAQDPMNYMYPTYQIRPQNTWGDIKQWGSEHPALSTFLGLMAAGGAVKGLGALGRGVKRFINPEAAKVEGLMAAKSPLVQSAEELATRQTSPLTAAAVGKRDNYNKVLELSRKSHGTLKGHVLPDMAPPQHLPEGTFQQARHPRGFGFPDLSQELSPSLGMSDPRRPQRLPKMASLSGLVDEIIEQHEKNGY